MKKLKSSTFAKIVAMLMSVLTLGLGILSTLFIVGLESEDAYKKDLNEVKTSVLENICESRSYDAVYNFSNYYSLPSDIYPNSGFCFVIKDSDGQIIFDNLEGRSFLCKSDTIEFNSSEAFFADSAHIKYVSTDKDGMPDSTDETGNDIDEPSKERAEYTLTGYMLNDIPDTDEQSIWFKTLDTIYNMRYELLAIAALSFILSLLFFVFLIAAAGHHKDSEAIRGTMIENIPFDIYTVAIILIYPLLAELIKNLVNLDISWVMTAFIGCIGAAVMIVIAIMWCMSLSVRLKLHTTLRGCVCYRILAWLWRIVKKLWSILKTTMKGIPLIPKAALITGALLFAEFIVIATCNDSGVTLAFWWFVERAVLVTLMLYALIGMKKLLAAGKEIAAGNLNYEVDTSKMRGVVREHGEDLNNISAGLNKAVAERMKSERMKTELITNVSHDIRTPLTSIINYVDLLSRNDIDKDTEREYIDVLERQSTKLKKLIDDLIEASKASSGSLTVNMEKCDMNVLLGQIAGEYSEKLISSDLELVQSMPETSVCILADGRHMWRVFDNLFSNVCKYSQKGTRVYLSLEVKDEKAMVSLKNISKTQLNISGDELMERFVRGDDSRNTEGSGLGLSIARSLTQLQKGEMRISVDGDLFKVELSFPIA